MRLNSNDIEYKESVYDYVYSSPKQLFTNLEFCYLHDMYCLYIGVETYYSRLHGGDSITIDEILKSKFFEILIK